MVEEWSLYYYRNEILKKLQSILAVPANFVLPENVSLANDYTMLQKV